MRRALEIALTAIFAMAAAAGCGFSSEETGGSGKRVTLYAANEVGFPEAIEGCNKKAGGRYSISYVPLPRTADAQRELMARRLAAEDTDIDLLSRTSRGRRSSPRRAGSGSGPAHAGRRRWRAGWPARRRP